MPAAINLPSTNTAAVSALSAPLCDIASLAQHNLPAVSVLAVIILGVSCMISRRMMWVEVFFFAIGLALVYNAGMVTAAFGAPNICPGVK